MRLSILLPSNRPEGLEAFLRSLGTYDKLRTEIIVLVDNLDTSIPEYVSYEENIVTIHKHPIKPLSIGNMQHECYKIARGQWIALANDDCLCATDNWDEKLFKELDKSSDGIALYWFNDELFGSTLSCFPIISRKALELMNFFPVPYQRYKIDDTLFDVFPFNRKYYLENIVFKHLNTEYKTRDFLHPEVGILDSGIWNEQYEKRQSMKQVLLANMDNPTNYKILIGVPTGEVARRGEFYDFITFLQKPNNTLMVVARGQSPAQNRNLIIQSALDSNCTHILFLDDDMSFNPDLLMRLLVHDKDVVGGIYFLRNYPHIPCIFDGWSLSNEAIYKKLYDESGLLKVTATGFGALLVKTSVLRKMEKPWVRLGELTADQWCDDIGFFHRLRNITTDIWCDLDATVGHMSYVTLWPNKLNGKWVTTYDTRGKDSISVPQEYPAMEMV